MKKRLNVKSLTKYTGKTAKEMCDDFGLNYKSFLNMNSRGQVTQDIIDRIEDEYKMKVSYDEERWEYFVQSSIISRYIPEDILIEVGSFVKLFNGDIRLVVDVYQDYGETWYTVDEGVIFEDLKLSNTIHRNMISEASKDIKKLISIGDIVNKHDVKLVTTDGIILADGGVIQSDDVESIITIDKMNNERYHL